MKGRSHGIFEPLALLASVGLLGSTLAGAQASDQGETPELVQIVVTGTLLPTTPDKVAVPIVTLDAKTLEQSGVTSNALEILRKSVPAFAGRSLSGPLCGQRSGSQRGLC